MANMGCLLAVKQVLNGAISERGILAPMDPELNRPLMKELKDNHGSVLQASHPSPKRFTDCTQNRVH
jgi:saccharopine dehydrogenase (NADP+, L-glutamate forming)